ncbi:NAD(P)/FAD-dependent oxidoreductase [Leuconostoc palmae]|uniref:NAD(P)/FAD-dependent oxidoreductase n=1 Tax=Leuconostoc palmae TaxID=501487 RepID=UPI001C7D842D|nr:NAD(P)/FAD-dependent oxidoreductase [Leuconostoc palmae]
MTEEIYDIAIIGGGPVGMFAAFYAGLRNTKVILIESLATLGGQVTALYPEKTLLDVAGFAGVTGENFIKALNEQLALFPVEIRTSTTVDDVKEHNNLFIISTSNHQKIVSKTIIIATGKGAFEPRKMQIAGVDDLVGQGVHYFVKNKEDFRNRDVAIVGGGDSAVDMATMLNNVTQSTTIIHRRNHFRAMEQSVQKLSESTVIQETPKRVIEVSKKYNGQLELTLSHVKDNQMINTITVDDLIVSYGFISESKTIQSWQVKPQQENFSFNVNQKMQTNIPGVFSIGDANHYDGKSDLIAVGFGEAPIAVNAAIRHFDPHRGGPGHSSSLSI